MVTTGNRRQDRLLRLMRLKRPKVPKTLNGHFRGV